MSNLEKLKKMYALEPGDVKWVPEGGDLLYYIGQKVVYVDYEKVEEEWRSQIKECTIISISDYDSVSMTYLIEYQVTGEEEIRKERIIPEGFCYEFTKESNRRYLNRFVPYSTHFRLMESELMYQRVDKLFEERDTLSLDELKGLSGNTKELLYCRNIVAAVKCEDGTLLQFRITGLKFYNHLRQESQLIISDDVKKITWSVVVDPNDAGYDLKWKGENIGRLKIIDLKTR